MKTLIVIGIVILAVGLLFESLLNVKSAFKWFSKNSEGEVGKNFNDDFKREFKNLSKEKQDEFIGKLEADEKVLFENYLISSKEDEDDLKDQLNEKHVFNLFNRWARQNKLNPINISSYSNK